MRWGEIPMTTEVAKKAEKRLTEFEQSLSEYDHAGVQKLREAVAESSIASFEAPDLSIEEWLDVLEELAGEAYATAYDDDYEIRWFLRHDGEAFIYGTRQTGELYRGKSAERQIHSVIENHDVYAYPIEKYPIEESDTFAENADSCSPGRDTHE